MFRRAWRDGTMKEYRDGMRAAIGMFRHRVCAFWVFAACPRRLIAAFTVQNAVGVPAMLLQAR